MMKREKHETPHAQDDDWLAGMSPEEIARYDEERGWDILEHEKWLAERSTRTNEDIETEITYHTITIERMRDGLDAAQADAAQATEKTGHARAHQSAQDKMISKLKAQIEELTKERDAVRKAYLDILSKQVERDTR